MLTCVPTASRSRRLRQQPGFRRYRCLRRWLRLTRAVSDKEPKPRLIRPLYDGTMLVATVLIAAVTAITFALQLRAILLAWLRRKRRPGTLSLIVGSPRDNVAGKNAGVMTTPTDTVVGTGVSLLTAKQQRLYLRPHSVGGLKSRDGGPYEIGAALCLRPTATGNAASVFGLAGDIRFSRTHSLVAAELISSHGVAGSRDHTVARLVSVCANAALRSETSWPSTPRSFTQATPATQYRSADTNALPCLLNSAIRSWTFGALV
jgi:hypothetical protein